MAFVAIAYVGIASKAYAVDTMSDVTELVAVSPSALIREARRSAGLTQTQLAERLGTTQPVIARLERAAANPTFETLTRALHAAGHRLELHAVSTGTSTVDEDLIRRQLALSPADRIRALDAQNATMNVLLRAGARSRGGHL
jgi:transcriptional regulator with XRE-family HTH domain